MEILKTTKRDLMNVSPLLIFDEGINTRLDLNVDDIIESIRENGVRQPLTCWKVRGEERYVLVHGHRRWTAVNQLIAEGVEVFRVPVMVVDKPSESERTLSAVLDNTGKPLSPLELGYTYRRLLNLGMLQGEIAKRIGRTSAHISQCLDLLELSPAVQKEIMEGTLSATQALDLQRTVKPEEIEGVINQAKATAEAKRPKTLLDKLPSESTGKKPKPDKLKIKLDDIEDELKKEGIKKNDNYKVTSCSDCPLAYQEKGLFYYCAISEYKMEVTNEEGNEKLHADCPLRRINLSIKLV